ncbi:hypothetical protein [Luteimonas granuli]|uniref:hypothetical protein n=1 Tax=Luteimonas granuli TaxID=1176533 RepID=UPI003CCC77B5
MPWVPHLRAAGYAVVAFDQPAHGRTCGQRTNLPEFIVALSRVAAAFGPAAALVGHSLGGRGSGGGHGPWPGGRASGPDCAGGRSGGRDRTLRPHGRPAAVAVRTDAHEVRGQARRVLLAHAGAAQRAADRASGADRARPGRPRGALGGR